MERVAFLIEDTGQRLECLLNPETLVLRRTAGVAPRRSTTGRVTGAGMTDDPLLYTGGGSTEIDLELLFDVSLAGASIAAEDVRELTAPLWNLAENSAQSGRYGRPPLARLIWGKPWNVLGVVVSVAERLERFTPEGVPRQSWMRLRMRRVSDPPAGADQAAQPAVRVSPTAVEGGEIRVPETTIAVHRALGGAAATVEEPSVAGAVVTGSDIVTAAVVETPAGQALMQTQAEIAALVDDMIAQVGNWLSEIGDSPLLRAIRDGLSRMAQRIRAVAVAAKTRLVETAVAASSAVAGAAQAVMARVKEAARELGQEIQERLQPLLENVVPVAKAMGEAARLVARAVKARAARLAAAAVVHIEWAVDRVEAALEQVSAAARRAGKGAIEAIQGAAANLRTVLGDIARTGKAALAERVPAALIKIGAALEELWSMGQRAAARAIEAGVVAASAGLQRIAAATEAIRAVARERILPTARAAVGSLRDALRSRAVRGEVGAVGKVGAEEAIPEEVSLEEVSLEEVGLEEAEEDERAAVLPPEAALAEVEIAVDALRSVVTPEALAPAEEALDQVREALAASEAAPDTSLPDLESALDAIEAAAEAVVAAEEAEVDGRLRDLLSSLHERVPEVEIDGEATPPAAALEAPVKERAPAGERLDQIAYRYYRDAALWRLVALANDIQDPFRLPPDRPLRIPSAAEWRTT